MFSFSPVIQTIEDAPIRSLSLHALTCAMPYPFQGNSDLTAEGDTRSIRLALTYTLTQSRSTVKP